MVRVDTTCGKSSKSSLRNGDLPDRGMVFEIPEKDLECLSNNVPDGGASPSIVGPSLYDFDFSGHSLQNTKEKVQISQDVTKLIRKEEMHARGSKLEMRQT